jgi:hypothetical protein
MKRHLLPCLLFSVSMCWADVNQVKELLQSTLTVPPDGQPQYSEEFSLRLLDAAQGLTVDEFASILPIAAQCLKSSSPRARDAGLSVFGYAALKLNSSAIMEPYLDDFDAILSGAAGPYRQGIINILGITNPALSAKATQMLSRHLEDKANSLEEVQGIASALISGSRADPAMIHRVINFAEKRGDDKLTMEVLRVLGLIRTRNGDALDFIGKGLASTNRFVRESALNATSRMDRDVRVKFAAQLGRIASDMNERPEIRARAAESISKQ